MTKVKTQKITIISPSQVKSIVDSEIRKNNDYYNKTLTKLRERIIELERICGTSKSKIKFPSKNKL